jgi:hypothetical protein
LDKIIGIKKPKGKVRRLYF